ncbi:V-type ATP synthase subunit E family protein [Geomesophilobacter sediminis]|uniref:V-type ATP synthase subunit E n=1 Tax=Geomesophilobacter sediminis TaxID=2798584 RepID=A0A8J7JLE9_9BACT|nr:V-type ATP synthase subunit E family protein [Geomesophilobacter sediminis]MBJ6725175.1 hypothetical protein [Geomesophilobacter sediminis]
MGHRELIESLREAGAADLRAIQEQSAAAAAAVEADCAVRIAGLRRQYALDQEMAVAAERGRVIATAQGKGALIRLEAESLLAERLFRLAQEALARLRQDTPSLFEALAAELPSCRWETVRVNPADRELAAAAFPEAQIEAEAGIHGGMVAVAPGGRIRVDNTLEKRLERAWPQLLPRLVQAIAPEE